MNDYPPGRKKNLKVLEYANGGGLKVCKQNI